MTEAFRRHRAACEGRRIMDIREHLTKAARHRCEASTEAIDIDDETGKRNVDAKVHLCIKYGGNVLRLLETKLDGRTDRWIQNRIQKSEKRKQSTMKPAKSEAEFPCEELSNHEHIHLLSVSEPVPFQSHIGACCLYLSFILCIHMMMSTCMQCATGTARIMARSTAACALARMQVFFSGQNVYIGQRSPIMCFFLSFCGGSVHGEVSIKRPTSKLHYPYFFSDIQVVSYVLFCA